jgi:hypothetical protein
MVKGHINGLMDLNTVDNSKMEWGMAKDYGFQEERSAIRMRENIKMTWSMATDCIDGQMLQAIKAISKLIVNMVKEP